MGFVDLSIFFFVANNVVRFKKKKTGKKNGYLHFKCKYFFKFILPVVYM